MKNANLFEYLADNYDITPNADNALILAIEDYKDQKQDARINEIGKILDKIYTWVAIIGICYLIKIIGGLFLLFAYGSFFAKILEKLA